MDIRQLRYFVAVAEERHFGRAAERLHMAQPPLSQQIKQLENELGVRLLERTTRRVDLTTAGELMLERARAIIADVESLAQDVREIGRGSAGVIRLGFVGSAIYELMPRMVRLAKERLPQVKVQVVGEKLTPGLESSLLENRLDLAILRPPVLSAEIDLETLSSGRLVLAVPAGHRLADGTGPVALADLADDDLVSYPADSAITMIVQEAARRVGFRPRFVQRASETSTVMSFVAAAMGVAIVPASVIGQTRPGTVVFRPLPQMPPVEFAVAVKQGARNPLVARFMELAHQAADELAAEQTQTPSPVPVEPESS